MKKKLSMTICKLFYFYVFDQIYSCFHGENILRFNFIELNHFMNMVPSVDYKKYSNRSTF